MLEQDICLFIANKVFGLSTNPSEYIYIRPYTLEIVNKFNGTEKKYIPTRDFSLCLEILESKEFRFIVESMTKLPFSWSLQRLSAGNYLFSFPYLDNEFLSTSDDNNPCMAICSAIYHLCNNSGVIEALKIFRGE